MTSDHTLRSQDAVKAARPVLEWRRGEQSPRRPYATIQPDTLTKLAYMGEATAFEPSGDQPIMEKRRAPYQSRSLEECITNVATPTGKKPILKTMLTTACERNCFYCPFRAGRGKTKRMTFSPDEVAGALDTLSREKRVGGIFLSSGIIKGSVTTQDKIIDPLKSYALVTIMGATFT